MSPRAYYNEFDPKTAAWLRELIRRGLIAAGDVDERSICDVQPDDLKGYTQCHFFAGIGGWSYALRLAGWSDDRPVWTGSCPCQPFSAAGKQKGHKDERHLWPVFHKLISKCRPPVVFGEQVASSEVVGSELEASFVAAVERGDYAKANKLAKRLAQGQGGFHYWPRWVDGVRADLEADDYSLRFMVLGAHSVGAPHIRQRLYWLAHAELRGAGMREQRRQVGYAWKQNGYRLAECSETNGMADAECDGGRSHEPKRGPEGGIAVGGNCENNWLAHAGFQQERAESINGMENGARHETAINATNCGEGNGIPDTMQQRLSAIGQGQTGACPRSSEGFWSDYRIIHCGDGKARRLGPLVATLAHRVPARVVRIRGYGNAIVPQVAAEFIKASDEALTEITRQNGMKFIPVI